MKIKSLSIILVRLITKSVDNVQQVYQFEYLLKFVKLFPVRLKSTVEAEAEDIPNRRKVFDRISKLKLQQLNLVRQLTEVMRKVEPAPNLDLVLKKVEAELKEAIQLSRR